VIVSLTRCPLPDHAAVERVVHRGFSGWGSETVHVLQLRRPSAADLAALARSVSSEALTYGEVGATARDEWPAGYRHDRETIVVGEAAAFETAVAQLRAWQPHLGSGVQLAATDGVETGTTVALAAPVLGMWVLATCRIVYVQDEPDCFAWAYGTLPLHPEEGEERFEVRREDGTTTFSIAAFSRPRHWLARSAAPVARRLQAKATAAYLAAMQPVT
jgi:uncharacterized protein (UPF0548 family)